jgi:hypothetical protein
MVFSPRDSDDNDNDDPESSSTTPQDLTVATTVTVTVPTVTVTAAPTPYQDKYEHDGDWSATGTAILASPTPTNPSSLSSLEDHGSGLPSTLQTGYEKAGLIAGVIGVESPQTQEKFEMLVLTRYLYSGGFRGDFSARPSGDAAEIRREFDEVAILQSLARKADTFFERRILLRIQDRSEVADVGRWG